MLTTRFSKARKNAHEAGERDEVDLGVAQGSHVGAFGVLVQLGAEAAGFQKEGRDATFAGAVENAGVGRVADDEGDVGGEGTLGAGVGDGGHVGAFAGAEHAELNRPLPLHGNDGRKAVG